MKRIVLFASALLLLSVSFSLAGSESNVSGTYVNKADKEYLTLYPDGTLFLKVRKQPADPANPFLSLSGKYKMTGEDIALELEGGGDAGGKIKGSTFVDNEGKAWVKEGSSVPPEMDPGTKKGKPLGSMRSGRQ